MTRPDKASGSRSRERHTGQTAVLYCASLLALPAVRLLAQIPETTNPSAASVKPATVPQLSREPTTSIVTVPFDLFLKRSPNPFNAYRGKTVPQVKMANSPLFMSFIREGKIYLTLGDAIDLALEDNLDMVIAITFRSRRWTFCALRLPAQCVA